MRGRFRYTMGRRFLAFRDWSCQLVRWRSERSHQLIGCIERPEVTTGGVVGLRCAQVLFEGLVEVD